MGLLSIFKRTTDASGGIGTSEASDAVRTARTRARRRLIGAVVLLVIGVIGFPLVFETRPRPIPVDIPIEIPKKEGAPALVMPPPRPVGTVPALPPSPGAKDEIITETHADAGREVAPRPAPAASVGSGTLRPAAKPASGSTADVARRVAPAAVAASTAPAETARKPAPPAPAASTAAESTRARAILDAKPAAADAKQVATDARSAAADTSRFVVQVGAFAEAEAARETRAKAEKLGLKTYTQVAQTPAGSRIRVRVGPFGTRAEADAALAKARAAGLAAVVLTL